MQNHPWITKNGKDPCSWEKDVSYVKFEDPTEEEMNQAMTKVEQIKNVYFRKK
jgi:hypothetical protein